MKKLILSVVALGLTVGVASAQDRYLDEIFSDVTVTSNVVYGENYKFVPPSPTPPIGDLVMDVYEGTGDTETGRAVVICLHTGNFLPKYFNGSFTGNNQDSSLVEAAKWGISRRGNRVPYAHFLVGPCRLCVPAKFPFNATCWEY